MNQPIQGMQLGGDMVQDLGMMAAISAEAMRIDRLVKKVDLEMQSGLTPIIEVTWNQLSYQEKARAIVMAEDFAQRTKGEPVQ